MRSSLLKQTQLHQIKQVIFASTTQRVDGKLYISWSTWSQDGKNSRKDRGFACKTGSWSVSSIDSACSTARRASFQGTLHWKSVIGRLQCTVSPISHHYSNCDSSLTKLPLNSGHKRKNKMECHSLFILVLSIGIHIIIYSYSPTFNRSWGKSIAYVTMSSPLL